MCCTTLYFEARKEDDYRRPGLSKERRPGPQIKTGLLVDKVGFPLEIQGFDGNRGEVKTLIPVLASFKARYGLESITVTADAAMFSAGDMEELERLGYTYIIASRISKTPYEIEEYLSEDGVLLSDNQIFDSRIKILINKKRLERRVIYQYRKKRAARELLNMNRQIEKAENMVQDKIEVTRNRFLKLEGARKSVNHELVARTRRKAGIKGYVTNLDARRNL